MILWDKILLIRVRLGEAIYHLYHEQKSHNERTPEDIHRG